MGGGVFNDPARDLFDAGVGGGGGVGRKPSANEPQGDVFSKFKPKQPEVNPYSPHRYGVKRVFHETSPDNAIGMAHSYQEAAGYFVSPSEYMALGQSQKGAVVEMGNLNGISVRPYTGKPGLTLLQAEAGGIPQEMQVIGGRLNPDNVASITIKPGARVNRVSLSLLRLMTKNGWIKEVQPGGSTKFMNPKFLSGELD